MDKVKFDANVLNLYSYDYEHMQDSAEESIQKSVRQTIQQPYVPSVLRGFDITISIVDDTKLKMYHNEGIGNAINYYGEIIETAEEKDEISLSDYTNGTVNYIYLKYYVIDGSYDKATQTIVEGEKKAIDLSDGSKEYNRSIDKWDTIVYTSSEYSALSTEDKRNLICLGSIVAQGYGSSLIEVLTTGRVTAKTFIAPESVTDDAIVAGISQSKVSNSDIYDDNYYNSPQDLEDDLNRIRTEIKDIKGTADWDDTASGDLTAFDYNLNELHFNGIFDSGYNLECIPTSSGTKVLLKAGKALVEGKVDRVIEGEEVILELSGANESDVVLEEHWVDNVSADTFYLNHGNINPASLVIREKIGGRILIYDDGIDPDPDYTVDFVTGLVTATSTGDMRNEYVECSYSWGDYRYDLVVATSTGTFEIIEGIATGDSIPPDVGKKLILFAIYRDPYVDTITGSNIKDCRNFAAKVRNLTTITADLTANTSWLPYRLTYLTSSGIVDSGWSQWTITSTGSSAYAMTSTGGAKIRTLVHVDEGGELYINLAKKQTGGSVTVAYETSTGTGVMDGSITIDLSSNLEMLNTMHLVATELTEGYHLVEITVNTSTITTVNSITFGKNDSKFIMQSSHVENMYVNTNFEVREKMYINENTMNMAYGYNIFNNAPKTTCCLDGSCSDCWNEFSFVVDACVRPGGNNIAIGENALHSICSECLMYDEMGLMYSQGGHNNIAIGHNAHYGTTCEQPSVPGCGYYGDASFFNISIGVNANKCLTSGICNIAIGLDSLKNNMGSVSNIAIGNEALYNSCLSSCNIGIGNCALCSITGACYEKQNIAIGISTLRCLTNGCYNTAIAVNAGSNANNINYTVLLGNGAGSAMNTSNNTIAIGRCSLTYACCVDNLIGIGYYALRCNREGAGNIGIGTCAGYNNRTGTYNIAIGENALKGCSSCCNRSNNIAIGYNALCTNIGCCNIALGNNSLCCNPTCCNIGIGNNALCNVCVGSHIAIGINALSNACTYSNIAIGNDALVCSCSIGDCGYNIALGHQALKCAMCSSHNIALGYGALYNSRSPYNIAIGICTLCSNTDGYSNIAIGTCALCSNTDGSGNIAIGRNALCSNISGSHNITLRGGLSYLTTGEYNFSVASNALHQLISGSHNIAIGSCAGYYIDSDGQCNIYIGKDAGADACGTSSCNIIIGNNSGSTSQKTCDTISIGNNMSGDCSSSTYISNIHGKSVHVGCSPQAVWVDSTGKLGCCSASSYRYKEDIVDFSNCHNSSCIYKLRPVNFTWKEWKAPDIGLIAEEVHEVLPNLVYYKSCNEIFKNGSDELIPEAVKYEKLPIYLLEEMKKLKIRIDELEARLN